MEYLYWSKNMSTSRFQRQQCYLCDCPRAPWAILNDFSEPICRGCCNYEGPERIEAVIDYVRSLRKGWDQQVRASKLNMNSTGTSIGSSPSPGGHSNGSMETIVSIANSTYPFSQYNGMPQQLDHFRFLHNLKGEHHGPSENHTGENFSQKNIFTVPNEPSPQIAPLNSRTADEAHEEHRRFLASLTVNSNKDNHVRVPIIHRPEYSEYPDIVRETLEVLNSCVPFDIRFKKDHNHIGRVFLFEAAPRTGTASPNEFELKIHIEYPRGSENFCQSASSVAKQMYQDSMKDYSRGLSSGFKYLEYEVHGNEWRLLGDLLPEQIRVFKEPVGRVFLPMRLVDYPPFHSMLGPPMAGLNKYRPKRKAEDVEVIGAPSRAPRRTYKEREDEQIQRHLWMQSQVDALRLSMAHLTGTPEEAMHLNSIRSGNMLDLHRHPTPLSHAPLPPSSQPLTSPHQPSKPPWGVPSSMAALISAASAETNGSSKEPRKLLTESKSKSPLHEKSPFHDKSPLQDLSEIKENAKAEDINDRKEENLTKKVSMKNANQLKCSICEDWLEDTHFVQCPSVAAHKFCFPCSKDSIKKQGFGSDVFCPSGKQCPLIGNNLPWAFMQSEIQTILATKPRSRIILKEENVEDKS